MADKDVLGRAGEDRAARHLEHLGWQVIERNWRCPNGELDIVARDGAALVAVEVKTRRGLGYGHPFEAITARKLARVRLLLRAWLAAHPEAAGARTLRVDAIALVGPDPASAPLEHLRGLR